MLPACWWWPEPPLWVWRQVAGRDASGRWCWRCPGSPRKRMQCWTLPLVPVGEGGTPIYIMVGQRECFFPEKLTRRERQRKVQKESFRKDKLQWKTLQRKKYEKVTHEKNTEINIVPSYNQRLILRDRRRGTTSCPACRAMGTNKLK
jgi:hypothetical protein